MTERGKYVRGSLREGHNVFTVTGRDWLAHLCAWQTVGSPDVPYTQRRVRWCGVGTGTQLETVNVTQLNAPALVTPGIYLGNIETSEFPALQQVRFFKEFDEGEISLPGEGLPVVAVTEVGLFVDVYPASVAGGVDDAAVGAFDTTLNPAVANNAPVAYKTFDVINKTIDFKLEIRWDFRFG
jgi:hypothetical protein